MATISLYKDKLNGVGGLIDSMIKSVDNLDVQIGTLKSTLQGVNSSDCNLDATVESIRSSSKAEKDKIADLKKLNKKVNEFITTTVRAENAVRDEINKAKNEFYEKYSYLKPECEKGTIEKIVDAVETAAEWCQKHWKLVVTVIIVIAAVALLITGVGGVILAGACWGAIMGAVIGGVSGGLDSMANGGSFLDGFEDGAFSGAIGGAIGGAAFAGLGAAGAALGKGIQCASTLGKAVKGIAAVSKVISTAMGGFDTLALFDKAFGNGDIANLNAKLHSSKAYNIFQTGISAVAVFTGGMTSTMQCFVAGTLILTATGLVAIDAIKVGDRVYAADVDTQEVSLKPVVNTYISETSELVHLMVNGEEIISTRRHPYYVRGKGFIDACNLWIGAELLDKQGNTLFVEQIFCESLRKETVRVYNIEIEDYHTYFVGECGVWVHNKCVAIKNEDGSYDVIAEYKEGWTGKQKSAADRKCKQLTEADTKIASKQEIDARRSSSSSSNSRFRKANKIPKDQDVDHIQDLQFGGMDVDANKQGLNRGVNRSLGRQFKNATKDLPVGTKIRKFVMKEK